MKECEVLIERLDTEIQRRQPTLYPSHDGADILRPDRAELELNTPTRKKKAVLRGSKWTRKLNRKRPIDNRITIFRH